MSAKRLWRISWLRPGCEQAQAEALGKVTRSELPLDAIARVVEPRSEGAEPSLAGRDCHDSTADTALARKADVIQPVTGCFVKARRRHDRQAELAAFRLEHAVPGQWVDAAIGERCAHNGKIFRGDVERTLPR